MSWNYRIVAMKSVADETFGYAIHEVFYDDDGTIKGYTEKPVCITGESLGDISEALEMMAKATTLPIMEDRNEKLVEIEQEKV